MLTLLRAPNAAPSCLCCSVDFPANAARAAALDVDVLRPSIVDFNPESLRHNLARAVAAVARGLERGADRGGRVYVHCTAGLGRAPAVCIAYLYWFKVARAGRSLGATAVRRQQCC